MSRQRDEIGDRQVWKSLSEAGLLEITLDQFPERIKEVKSVVMRRLSELLELKAGLQERESAAYSLGTLKNLEANLHTGVVGPFGPATSKK
jgi:hypothetical protein